MSPPSPTSICISSARAITTTSIRSSARIRRARRRARDALRGVGAECAARERGRRLQFLGRRGGTSCSRVERPASGRCSFPDVGAGALYKYEIVGAHGHLVLKADPYGFQMQLRPDNASVVADIGGYNWSDGEWLAQRRELGSAALADLDLRTASRIVAALVASQARVSHVGRARRPVDSVPPRHGLHARRTGRRRRASVRRLMGLSGARSLRADRAARLAARFHALRRSSAHGRHRRVHGLGAGALSEGCARARGVRRHVLCTSTPIRSAASTRSGARRSSTTAATRCAISSSRTRCSGSSNITSTGCAWTPSLR